MLPPGASTAYEARMDAVPDVGQHTEAILREAGVDAADVARLRADGAV
jgi:itaconate CoA-transferase